MIPIYGKHISLCTTVGNKLAGENISTRSFSQDARTSGLEVAPTSKHKICAPRIMTRGLPRTRILGPSDLMSMGSQTGNRAFFIPTRARQSTEEAEQGSGMFATCYMQLKRQIARKQGSYWHELLTNFPLLE